MRLIRALLLSSKPRHIRDLAAEYGMSPSGVSDILRRLQKAGVLKEFKNGNKRAFLLSISDEERNCLREFFRVFERRWLEDRAPSFNKRAKEKLEWMDEEYKFYRDVKGRQ